MDPRHNQSIQTARATVTNSPAPQEPPKKQRKPPSAAAQAARVVDALNELDDDERQELAASPASIRAKYEDRRGKVLSEVPAEVLALVEKLRTP